MFRTVYQMSKKPYIFGGLALLAGYVIAGVRHDERPVSKELVEFRRCEQMVRLKRFLTGGKAPQPHSPPGS
jgi:biofilm PGA synthesis N-glycosyltransferase PgaC